MKTKKLLGAFLGLTGVALVVGSATAQQGPPVCPAGLCAVGLPGGLGGGQVDYVAFQLLGQCMDVTGGVSANGTPVQLWTCNGGGNQAWHLFADGTLRPKFNTGKCLDLTNWSTANGNKLEIWDCNGGANQKWTADPVYHYLVGYGGKCVDAPNFSSANGTVLDYWTCNKGTNQQFFARAPQYCTVQSGATFQDWENTSSPPNWFRVYDITGNTNPGKACGNSCTYTRFMGSGNYGSCPF